MLPNQSALPRGRGLYEGWGRWGAQRREGKWFGHQKVKVSFSHMTWEQSKREEKALIEPLVCYLPPTSTFLLREAMATHTPKIKIKLSKMRRQRYSHLDAVMTQFL